ncbi:MAG: exosortase T [Pseudomonadota bacterium]
MSTSSAANAPPARSPLGRPRAGQAAAVLLVLAAAIAAAEPLRWLVTTWTDPSYGSDGWVVALAIAVLAVRSALSPRRAGYVARPGRALLLVAGTLALRIAGEVMAIGVLGGLALALDVLALGLAAGLHERERAVSPFWLAVAFLFALPLERILQRLLGYPMQSISADGACGLLALLPEGLAGPLSCEGLAITLGSARVLVDLPCSGARGVLLQGLFFALLCAHYRPRFPALVVGGTIALGAALLANSLRIAAIAVGEALGVPLLAEPWHGLTGLAAILVAAIPAFLWASCLAPRGDHRPHAARIDLGPSKPRWRATRHVLVAAIALCLIASGLSFLPKRPLDAGASMDIALPSRLAGHQAVPWALSGMEETYYARFGGGAASAEYGPMALTVVASTAPLRHLHAPEECLAGIGFELRLLSTDRDGLATAHYRATSPDGRVWHVAASFVAEDGTSVPGIGEAAWAWLTGPRQRWRMIRRITPWDMAPAERAGLEAAARAALDLAPLPGPLTTGGARLAAHTPIQHHEGETQ